MINLKRFNHFWEYFLFWSTAITAFTFFIAVLVTILSRYLHVPMQSSTEISRLFFIWSCFLAAALTYRRKAHIAITFLVDKMGPALQRSVSIVMQIITILFLGAITWYGLRVTIELWATEFPMLKITQGLLYLPVPFISCLMIFFSIEEMANQIFHG